MMNASELHKMYQAWQQGNDHYVKDWFYFAQYAARINNTTTDVILNDLQKYQWFKKQSTK